MLERLGESQKYPHVLDNMSLNPVHISFAKSLNARVHIDWWLSSWLLTVYTSQIDLYVTPIMHHAGKPLADQISSLLSMMKSLDDRYWFNASLLVFRFAFIVVSWYLTKMCISLTPAAEHKSLGSASLAVAKNKSSIYFEDLVYNHVMNIVVKNKL